LENAVSIDIPRTAMDWTSFVDVSGYPMIGEPGAITYYRAPTDVAEIHALLSYDSLGYLQGALMYFPEGSPYDHRGSVTVLVRPKRRRHGIGRALLVTALTMWPKISLDSQAYTPEGRALVAAVVAKPLGSKP
jgi:GNAT superfamily N-acetyltransferase